MTEQRVLSPPAGLTSSPLADALVEDLVAAACTAGHIGLDDVGDVRYAIAEFDHCYNVARRASGQWIWASTVFTQSSTLPSSAPRHQLYRIRLFGPHTELTVAADSAGGFIGFEHHGITDISAVPAHLWPRERSYLLIESPQCRLRHRDGFTLIEHPSGQSTVIPYAFDTTRTPLGHTREHFTADPATGAVSVAAVTWTGFSDGPTLSDDAEQETP